jgi:predicted restriction endonuclease
MRLHETDAADLLEDGVSRSTPESTQRSALVKSRIGQGQFRADVLGMWHSRCAVTGLDLRQLVRASHIKPWRDSNNSERLDPYNGLPLAPGYDAAFDAGLITFKNDGEVVVSDSLPRACLAKLGINITDRITGLQEKHLSYLDYHRSEVFTQSM